MTCVLAIRTARHCVVVGDRLVSCDGSKRVGDKVLAFPNGIAYGYAGTVGPLWRAIQREQKWGTMPTLNAVHNAVLAMARDRIDNHQYESAISGGGHPIVEDVLVASKEDIIVLDNLAFRCCAIPVGPGVYAEAVGNGRDAAIGYLRGYFAPMKYGDKPPTKTKLIEAAKSAVHATSDIVEGVGTDLTVVTL